MQVKTNIKAGQIYITIIQSATITPKQLSHS